MRVIDRPARSSQWPRIAGSPFAGSRGAAMNLRTGHGRNFDKER